MQLVSNSPILQPKFSKDVVTTELLADVTGAKAEVERTNGPVLIKNQNALMLRPFDMLQIVGGVEGATFTKIQLEEIVKALNSKSVEPSVPAIRSFIDHGFIIKGENTFSLSPEAGKNGLVVVSSEESSPEISRTLLHEKRHQKFLTNPTEKAEVLARVDSLSPEQKILGFILLRIPGGYETVQTTRAGGESYELFATEIDAHASMTKDGYDVSTLISSARSDFKSSVKEVFEGLKKHFHDDKGLGEKQIRKDLTLKIGGNKAIIRIEDQLFTLQADSKGKLSADASSIKINELLPK